MRAPIELKSITLDWSGPADNKVWEYRVQVFIDRPYLYTVHGVSRRTLVAILSEQDVEYLESDDCGSDESQCFGFTPGEFKMILREGELACQPEFYMSHAR